MEKRCIFHIPLKINVKMASASQLRPLQMIQAFKDNGYVVDVVEGSAKERKESINKIKENIKNGVKYDFMYSESSTMPTLLTESHHLPTHPFLDFSFFKFLKKHDIKIGLFYRDMYWKFPGYGEGIRQIKVMLAKRMYKYDLRKYNKLLSILYLPTENCERYIRKELSNIEIQLLPPGCHDNLQKKEGFGTNIVLFYVGGLGGNYNLEDTMKIVSQASGVEMVLCCRHAEWEKERSHYEKYLNERITIIHSSGAELEAWYKKADIGILLIEPGEYSSLSMPYKTYEYIGHGLPIIASEGTAIGDLVKKQNIGWVIRYGDEVALRTLIRSFTDNPAEVSEKTYNVIKCIEPNLWITRAQKVQNDLCR